MLPHEVKHDDDVISKSLAVFYVANKPISREEIQAYLSTVLPDYMIPGVLMQIDNLPITINGKLDRVSLLEKLGNSADNDYNYAEYSEIAAFLAKLWQKLIVVTNKKLNWPIVFLV